ncbi:MAG: YitT family protein [Clostridia bacterium]|nr:YitT family protein [Clostridia bacterium]
MKKFLLYVRQYFLIILGAALYGIGTTCFIQAAKIATGGVVGVFNVVNLIHEIPVGLCVLIVNIPLIIISFFKFKPRFAINSMIGIVLTSAAIDLAAFLLGRFLPFTDDMLLSALAGALFNGAGTGLIMRNGSSTGGSDIITKLIHRKLRHLKGGVIAAALGLVVCVFYFAVTRDVQGTLYSALTIVVSNKVFDLVLYGGSDSKTVYIITDNSEKMAEAILTETHAGATILDGTGAYTKSDRKIILCVIRNSVFPTLKQLVKSVDEHAFMIVTTSSEVFGKGYEDFNTERL